MLGGSIALFILVVATVVFVVLFVLRCFRAIKWSWWIVAISVIITVLIWGFVIWVFSNMVI